MMIRSDSVERGVLGRIAYIDPLLHWGYLHGPRGERVYFHTAGVLGTIAELELGDHVRYHLADGGDQLCAVHLARCQPRGA